MNGTYPLALLLLQLDGVIFLLLHFGGPSLTAFFNIDIADYLIDVVIETLLQILMGHIPLLDLVG
mgnify:CR=1 FL=1